MPGPRRKFRERPKKLGAKKNAKVNAQKRRLVEGGIDEAKVNEAPMDKVFQKDWNKSAKAFITHIKHELKTAKGADKTVLKKMLLDVMSYGVAPYLAGYQRFTFCVSN